MFTLRYVVLLCRRCAAFPLPRNLYFYMKGQQGTLELVKGIGKVASTALVAVAVALAVALVGVRLLGFEVYTVLSGSMEPTYKTGSVIWVDKCEPGDVEVGDPITFVMNEDLDVATHRVIEIDAESQHFYTQGDANDAPDGSPVHFNNLIGVPVFTVPYLGYFVSSIQSPPGCYVALIVAAAALVLMLIPELFDKADARKRQSADAERAQMEAARNRRAQRAGAPSNHDPRRGAQSGRAQQPATPVRQRSAYAHASQSRSASPVRQQVPRAQSGALQAQPMRAQAGAAPASANPQAQRRQPRQVPQVGAGGYAPSQSARANDPRRRAAQPNGIPSDSHSKAAPRRAERRETI